VSSCLAAVAHEEVELPDLAHSGVGTVSSSVAAAARLSSSIRAGLAQRLKKTVRRSPAPW